MALSDTERAVGWLENFRPEDRDLAKRLLNAFALDSWTSARASLMDLIRNVVEESRNAGPAWVLPAMDSGDIRKASTLSRHDSLIAFDNFDPGMDIPTMPGSEGLIGHLLRDVQGPGVLPPDTPITELRQKRIRTVIVVADTIETGGQVAKFVQALLRNSTLKSWRSFHWIRIVVLSYAASTTGIQVISSLPEVDELRYVRQAPTIRTLPWTTRDIDAALDLCTRYSRSKGALGYGDHVGLFGFQDRVPNTVPKIFRQNTPGWTALFGGKGGRVIPSDMVHELASSLQTPVAYEDIIRAVRQERLAVSVRKQQRESNRDILAALALLRVSQERASVLGVALDMTQHEVESMLAYLVAQGWIDAKHRITARGTAELAASKRKPRRVEPRKIGIVADPYYPESLR